MRNIYGVLDNQGGSFKSYFLENNMPEKIKILKDGLDDKSCAVIDKCLFRMLHLPDLTKSSLFFVDFDKYIQAFETDEEKFYRELYEANCRYYASEFNLEGDTHNVDTFLFHHGLYFQNKKIKDYIKNTCFIDAGAYIGDSVLVLNKYYSPEKIFSFELSKRNASKYKKIMEINKISENKYCIINKGISDKCDKIYFNDTGDQGVSLCYDGNIAAEVTSIDSFVEENNIKIGFIKADVEGYGFNALKGMKNTIANNRPVLSLAIYHTPEEFFEMKPYLYEITKDLNYRIEILHLHCFCDFLVDIVIFAYPKELYSAIGIDCFIQKIKAHPFANVLRGIF